MKKLSLLSVLVLTACGLSSELLYTDRSGNGIYQATCNGAFRSIGDCFKLAAQQCTGEFEIVQQDQYSAGTFGNFNGDTRTSFGNPLYFYNSVNSYSSGSFNTTNNIRRNIIYKCKAF